MGDCGWKQLVWLVIITS